MQLYFWISHIQLLDKHKLRTVLNMLMPFTCRDANNLRLPHAN